MRTLLTTAALLSLVACAPEPTLDAAPMPVAQSAIPETFDLQILPDPGVSTVGGPISFQVTNAPPNAILGLFVTALGYGPGICPSALNGDCLNIQGGVSFFYLRRANAQGNVTSVTSVPLTVIPDRTYYFQVVAYNPVTRTFTGSTPAERYIVDPVDCPVDDAFEDNDFGHDAAALSVGATDSGTVCNEDGADFFSFPTTPGSRYRVTLDGFDPLLEDLDLFAFADTTPVSADARYVEATVLSDQFDATEQLTVLADGSEVDVLVYLYDDFGAGSSPTYDLSIEDLGPAP